MQEEVGCTPAIQSTAIWNVLNGSVCHALLRKTFPMESHMARCALCCLKVGQGIVDLTHQQVLAVV